MNHLLLSHYSNIIFFLTKLFWIIFFFFFLCISLQKTFILTNFYIDSCSPVPPPNYLFILSCLFIVIIFLLLIFLFTLMSSILGPPSRFQFSLPKYFPSFVVLQYCFHSCIMMKQDITKGTSIT
uniref:Uncharacterized protein n=1 Tax=Cacopsylla melanoneura TaxID=428564 RepID=A0A8D9BW18_9HEMI